LNRKLLVLDIVLAAGVIYGGIEFHAIWSAAKARQARMPGPSPKANPVAPVPPLKREPAVLPSGYKDVAMKDLFDVTRNPTIPVDPPPPPPPPREPPPLPSYHGLMDFGDPQGPIALITPHDAPGHEEKHAGEMIGEFKLVSFNRQEMTLDWQGRILHKLLNEGGSEKSKPKAAVSGMQPLPLNGVIPGQAAPQSAYEPPKPQLTEMGPGAELTDTVRACQAGDSSAAGTVNGGFVKQVNNSPLGQQCIWRAVGK